MPVSPLNRLAPARHPQPLPREAAGAGSAGAPDLGPLPVWDLSGLYPEPAEPKIDADIEAAAAACQSFAADFEGKLENLSGPDLADAIARYEAIDGILGRVMSYVYLRHAQDATDAVRAKALGDAQTRVTDLSAPLVFFTLELNRISDAALAAKRAASPALQRYAPWLDRVRAARPHQLSDELEKYLHDQSVVGSTAWVRLYDETLAAMTFQVEGPDGAIEELGLEAALSRMMEPDAAKRAAAAKALIAGFKPQLPLFTRVTNTLVKEKEIDDRWRQYPAANSSRHLANQVEPEVVAALRDAVVAAYPRLSHRYYRLKAKWLGVETMEFWDRNAPLPGAAERVIGFDEARDTVLDAYGAFDGRMADIAREFFDKNWIDAPAGGGKSSGAFAHPTVVGANPFIMLNYLGQTRDVMTLAHELGHGVHQRLAAEQGELLSRTPLTLAETASVFGEMLTFRKLLDAETDPVARKALLARKVEDMINTVVRQISFYDFELKVHAARREGELTTEAIGALWMEVMHESLGDAFTFADGYETFWAYVSHFVHAPFYVYAYAFGDGLVNALYAVYEAEAAEGGAFQEKYFTLLKAGGSKGHKELLAPFGLDATDPAFWSHGLGLIERMIDELERMEA